jgi:hypothetical protein
LRSCGSSFSASSRSAARARRAPADADGRGRLRRFVSLAALSRFGLIAELAADAAGLVDTTRGSRVLENTTTDARRVQPRVLGAHAAATRRRVASGV